MNAFRPAGSDERDAGFTIVELTVTMVITGLILAIAGSFFANIAKLTTWSGNQRNATGQAALALDAIRSVIRVAADNPTSATTTDPAVLVALPSTLTLTAYSTPDAATTSPVKVTFTVKATGDLVETLQPGVLSSSGYWTFPGSGTTRVIASGFDTSPSTAFFGYVNSAGTLMNAATGLNATQRNTITFVRVTTTLDSADTDGTADPTVVTTSVGMPNISRDVSASISVPNLPTPTISTPTPTPTPTTSAPTASATPTTGSSGSSTSSTGTGSGSGSGSGTSTPTSGTGTGGTGSTGGGSGSSTPTATATPTPTKTATATPTSTPTPSQTTKKPVVG